MLCGDLGAVFMIEQLKGRRGSAQGHDLSMISRCYECLRAQQWTQRGVRTKAMTRRLFVPGKWLPARSYDRATNPLFELSPPPPPLAPMPPLSLQADEDTNFPTKGQGLRI